MGASIDIGGKLMTEAMKAGGSGQIGEAVETWLGLFATQTKAYRRLPDSGGNLDWDPGYDHKAMRRSRVEGH